MNVTTWRRRGIGPVVSLCLLLPGGEAVAQDVDPRLLAAIETEAVRGSRALEIVAWLTDIHGPRLTGAPATEEARAWTLDTLGELGLTNVREERFPFGAGWSLDRFHAHMVRPRVMPIIGYPRAWTSSTEGVVRAKVVRVDIRAIADLARYRGRLDGTIVLPQPARDVPLLQGDVVLRMNRALLDQARQPPDPVERSRAAGRVRSSRLLDYRDDVVQQFFLGEGVVAVLDRGSDGVVVPGGPLGSNLEWPTQRTDGGTVFVGSGGPRDHRAGQVVPSATIAVEHYNRMIRALDRGVPVEVELTIQTTFHPEDGRLNGFNLFADVPGTDLADEVVILGAHFDSTHASPGATDNAAGVAVMMEAARILRAIDARPRRTIRVALWGAEEQGLLGSREHVARHYADRSTGARTGDYARMAGYYNLDNGAGRIRGIWLQDNDAAAPIFAPWVDALRGLGVTTLGRRATGGTDHVAFDEVGLPGFQFIQDRLEYNSRTHHSNMDFLDRVPEEDLVQMAIVVAVFAYQTAMRDDVLPRTAWSPLAGR